MLLDSMRTNTTTNCNLESSDFKIEASPIAFDILTSKLYSDPKMAIVRELLTNAYDSHVVANNIETPIDISIPNYLNHNFIIRDYGTGLPPEDIVGLYTTFFSSTKNNSNDLTGCFGLGSKTPFSYTNTFTVKSYYNQNVYTFLAIKKDGKPQIISLGQAETKEPNGLEIIIPTTDERNSGDYDAEFYFKLESYIKFIPELNLRFMNESYIINRKEPIFTFENLIFYLKKSTYREGKLFIKQGQNVYPIDFSRYKTDLLINNQFIDKFNIVTEVPIGTLGITPSRETLADDYGDNIKITTILNKIEKSLESLLYSPEFKKKLGSHIPNQDLDYILKEIANGKYFNEFSTAYHIQGKMSYNHYFNDLEFRINTLRFNDITDDKYTSYGIPNNKKVLLIYGLYNSKYYSLKQLRGAIENYPELQNKQVIIIKPQYHIDLGNVISRYRDLINSLWVLNNLEEFNFDIELISINKFKRKYTNTRRTNKIFKEDKKEETTTFTDAPKDRNIRVRTVKVHSFFSHTYYSKGSISYLKRVKEQYTPKNTLLVLDERNDPTLLNPATPSNTCNILDVKIDALNILRDFKDKEGNYILREYLLYKFPTFDFDGKFNFLQVGKTVLNEFEDYKLFKFSEVFKIFQEADWYISDGEYVSESTKDMLLNYDRYFKDSFKSKEYEYIKKTRTYKKLGILRNMLDTHLIVNSCKSYTHRNIISKFIDISKKTVRTRFKEEYLRDRCCYLFKNWVKEYRAESYNVDKYLLTKSARINILNILKGDQ